MALTTQARVIAIPQGYRKEGGNHVLLFSVFIAPKLGTTRKTVLGAFPIFRDWASLKLEPTVEFFGVSALNSIIRSTGPAPEVGLWTALFPKDTPVGNWQRPAGTVESYAIAPLADGIKQVYSDQIPKTKTAVDQVKSSAPTGAEVVSVVRAHVNQTDFTRYHTQPMPPVGGCGPASRPEFHELIATVGLYPHLLRRLQLVLDLEVPLAAPEFAKLTSLQDPKCRVTLAVRNGSDPAWVRPWILCTLQVHGASGGYRFMPRHASQAPDHRNGFLLLDDARFGNTTTDVVSGTYQLGNIIPSSEPTVLPHLRNGGISIYRRDHGDAVRANLAATASLEQQIQNTANVDIGWEQLVRGLAVDIHDGTGWRSLCERIGAYFVGGKEVSSDVEDEGTVNTAARVGDNKVKVHEVMFTWEGYSLVAPFPLDPADPQSSPTPPRAAPSCTAPTPALETVFKPKPATLPSLRFGREYRVRARVVDVAGNRLTAKSSLPLDKLFEETSDAATKPITYRRLAAPRAPIVVAADGQPADMLVLQSIASPGPRTNMQYWLLPPAVSWMMWLEHGILDKYAPPGRTQSIQSVVKRSQQVVETLKEGHLPIFADPAVDRVLVRLEAGAAKLYTYVPFGQPDIANVAPVPIELVAGSQLAMSFAHGKLGITLPIGFDDTIAFTPCLSKYYSDQFEMLTWLGAARAEAEARAQEGTNETLCPAFRVRIVHAVAKPAASRLEIAEVRRDRAAAFARINGTATLEDPDVVGELELVAAWDDVRDDLSKPDPEQPKRVRVNVARVAVPRGTSKPPVQVSHVFPDTLHRNVQYRPVAVSRFGSFFASDPVASGSLQTGGSWTPSFDIPATTPPAAPDVAMVVPVFRWENRDAGTSASHERRGSALRVYLRRPWWSSGDGEMLALLLPRDDARNSGIPFVSQWGADPIYIGATTRVGGARHQLTRDMFRNPGPRIDDLAIHSNGTKIGVAAALFPIKLESNYSTKRHMWFCDIEMAFAEPRAYLPFVRLSLARCQPSAVRGADFDYRLSAVVLADTVQLQPDRRATVVRSGGKLTVTLDGDMPSDPTKMLRADVRIQSNDSHDADVGWADAGGYDMTPETPPGASTAQWVVRDKPIPNFRRYRLVIREFQLLPDAAGTDRAVSKISYLDVFE